MTSWNETDHRWKLVVPWLLLLLTGCAIRNVKHNFPQPELVPFSESGHAQPPERWWTAFEDAALNSYVDQAVRQNLDLSAAFQRLRAARALVRREASDLVPDLDGVISTDTTFGPGRDETRVTWGLDAAYQVDLWGQIQSRVDAERFRAEATLADYHTVALSLAAEVCRTWYSMIEAHAQLRLLEEQLKTNRDGLKAQELRFGIGDEGGGPDLVRQRQLVQSTLEQMVIEGARIEVLEHQLAVLTGELPQSATYHPGFELPRLPPAPRTGLPSELLMRRPDVQADYLALSAADRDLASAISAQYPRVNLFGSLVNSASRSEDLFRDWFLSIGSQLIAPLFDGGQRRAEVDRTSAIVRQRFDEYRQTMLIAFQEVEDNLALERYQIQRIERLNSQVKLAGQAAEQLKQRFIIGTATYLDYLSATQSQQRLQRDILSARLDLILIRIGLYLALAGDFDVWPHSAVDCGREEELGWDKQTKHTDQHLHSQELVPQHIERLPPVGAAVEIDE